MCAGCGTGSARATRSAALGGDVAQALRADAADVPRAPVGRGGVGDRQPDQGGSRGVLDSIADGHRRSAAVRSSLRVELAGPRATARLMSLLPLLGLGLAFLLGADPLNWLLTSPIGWVCLLAAVLLNLTGYWWITRIVRAIEEAL